MLASARLQPPFTTDEACIGCIGNKKNEKNVSTRYSRGAWPLSSFADPARSRRPSKRQGSKCGGRPAQGAPGEVGAQVLGGASVLATHTPELTVVLALRRARAPSQAWTARACSLPHCLTY